SIELKIASGLNLKQNLFDSVLNSENGIDEVDFSASGKAQFLQQLEEAIGGFMHAEAPVDIAGELTRESETLNGIPGDTDHLIVEEETSEKEAEKEIASLTPQEAQVQQMEQVMNNGLDFLSGLFKMATGSSNGLESRKMEFDRATGEVVMRFKLPGMQ
ncbi:MAG: hypothetical protein ACYCZO_05465, partial [Daejeonella sp.]